MVTTAGAGWRTRVRAARPHARALLGPHLAFTAALAAAVLLRAVAVLGYPTVFWFGDSGTYLKSALHFTPSPLRPSAYSLMLWFLHPFHDFRLIVVVQHLLGLGTAVLVYAVAWRWTRGRWRDRPWLPGLVGTVAAAPVLFDAYQIQLEHMLMSDVLFEFLAVAAVATLLWRRRLTWRLGLLAGALLAGAALTRTVGLPLLLVAVLCGAARLAAAPGGESEPGGGWAARWRPLAAMVAIFAVGLGGYAGWYKSVHGRFELSATDGFFLYGRTAAFADCAKIKPPPDLAGLCHDWKHDTPGVAPGYAALWGARSPFRAMPGGVADQQGNLRAARFAQRAILAQPRDYLRRAFRDTGRSFSWSRSDYPTPWTVAEYRFPVKPWQPKSAVKPALAYGHATAVPKIVAPFAGWMRSYQRVVYLPGALLGVLLLVGMAGVARHARDWGGPALLPWLTAFTLLVVPPFTADFDYRYLLPVVPFAALAAALGWFTEAVSSTSSDL
ncbi:hypothetical protein [Actinomadura harenae]|uniref:Glycosyltransferase RgtA/B/C/D-like domain-containing protein n=1 Tax=Actinomadura harenae TaxID=2483351 RepID=A0A3M2MDC0_9ACTN|nr:hypothetical protein [Actinomadura harenae]RMI46980.1 hypothetical protein EBO15_04985 [Actinomadura harenae]